MNRGALGCDPGLYCANMQLMDYCGYDYNYEQGTCEPEVVAVNGVCAATHFNCTAGTSANGVYNSSTGFYTWSCNGANGGTNVNCSEGVSNPTCAATHYNCTTGVKDAVSYGYTAGTAMYYWYCDATVGATKTYCTEYVKVNGVCDNTTTNACLAGNSANSSSSGGYFYWNCNGINGGTNASCSHPRSVSYARLSVSPATIPYGGYATYSWNSGPNAQSCLLRQGLPPGASGTSYPPNGSMTVGPLYSSQTYNGYCINWSDPSQWYFGVTGDPWGDFVTVTVQPLNGACSATHYACSAGTSVNNATLGDRWSWDCQGANGGTTAVGCTQMYPVNGVCSSVHYGCNTSPTAISTSDNPTSWTWTCPGQYGGSNTSCVENKIIVNGVCGPSPANQQHYQCVSGNSVNAMYNSLTYLYTWNCNGANGGTNANCSENVTPPPVNGQCDAIHYNCLAGTSIGGYDAGDAWVWNCAGSFGGATPTCTQYKPVDGVCGTSHYACTKGTSVSSVDGANSWTWSCAGSYGGQTTNCTEYKPPVVVWTPATATIDYNTSVSFTYSATNAVSCDYYTLDGSGNISGTIWTNGPTSAPWSGPQGPYQQNVDRRMTCKNISGQVSSADLHIAVRQNDASCVSISAPSYLAPLEQFIATGQMKNTGTNPWSADYPANYILWNPDSTWGNDKMTLQNPIVGAGVTGRFSANLKAPAAEGDYSFIWQMRPIFSGSSWPVFGQPCGISTVNGNKIRVKSPTLAVDPQSYQFNDTVIGDAPSKLKIHVKNLGGGKITGVKIANADLYAPFSCAANCNITLLGGGEDDITLAFTPTATTTVSRNVHLVNNEGYPLVITSGGQPVSVNYLSIYGRGTDKYAITSDEGGLNNIPLVDFGDVPWTRAKYMNVYLWNKSLTDSGDVDPNIDPAVGFTCESGCTPATIPSGGHIMIRLKFLPPYLRAQTYETQLHTGSAIDVSFSVIGNGVKPEFTTTEQ